MSRDDNTTDAYDELVKALKGEELEAIVFGKYTCSYANKKPPQMPIGVLYGLAEAEPFMRGWSFDGGFGGAETFPVYAWTKTRVIFIHEYDGSTFLTSVPRHPVMVAPGIYPEEA